VERVGGLAAGWKAGAERRGVKLPAWVSRHGPRRSAVSVLNSIRQFRITLTNAVKYVTSAADYDRRIKSAIGIQARKMQRQADFLLTRALKRAGWKRVRNRTGFSYADRGVEQLVRCHVSRGCPHGEGLAGWWWMNTQPL